MYKIVLQWIFLVSLQNSFVELCTASYLTDHRSPDRIPIVPAQ